MRGLENLLDTEIIGKRVYYFEELDSTNNKAYELAEGGAEEGTIVIADAQTRGKGRLGRRWESPAGVNLYLSIILRPKLALTRAPLITLMASIGVCEAIKEAFGMEPKIKWPNDILLNDRKVCGILVETQSISDRLRFVILGIGINLNMEIPDYLRNKAISIKGITNKEVNRSEFSRILIKMVEKWYNIFLNRGDEVIIQEWKRYSTMREGGLIRVLSLGGGVIEGYYLGLDRDGALLLRDREGGIRRIMEGDVTLL